LHVTGTLHPPVDNNYFKNVNANHIPSSSTSPPFTVKILFFCDHVWAKI
jgi:hypothetical protein